MVQIQFYFRLTIKKNYCIAHQNFKINSISETYWILKFPIGSDCIYFHEGILKFRNFRKDFVNYWNLLHSDALFSISDWINFTSLCLNFVHGSAISSKFSETCHL